MPAAPGPGAVLLRAAYSILTVLLTPFLLAHLAWRGLKIPGYRQRIPERFGFNLPDPGGPTLWVHAVSVGEVQAAAPLVRALLERHPGLPLILTTMTPTGSERARALFGDRVLHSYVPYDLAFAVRRFFDRLRPKLAIIMETELWPNLWNECGARQIPLVLASARVSPRSVRYYRRLVPLFQDALSHGILIAAQTPVDAQRFRSLGASAERTHVTGNVKFDFELPADVPAKGLEFRQEHAPGRAVWVAASTHEGEEAEVLRAHARLLQQHPDALLILVPRHPQRFGDVATLVTSLGYTGVTRSSGRRCTPETQVFLGDTMGELTTFYAAADVAFVGGSLVPIGGHNLLEPAALGLPVLTGPYNQNAADIAALLMDCGAAELVADAEALGQRVSELLNDGGDRARRGAAGMAAIAANRGTLGRLLALVEPLIEERDS